jgi:hypothetical protein
MLGKYDREPTSCSPLTEVDDTTVFPCGLLPYYFFTDSFKVEPEGAFVENEIAWKGEVGNLFKEPSKEYTDVRRWLLELGDRFPGETINEHFVVWMRITKDSNFRKLWARAAVDSLGPQLDVAVNCTYSYDVFAGERKLVLMKMGGMGGKNIFITIVNFLLFALCGGFALIFHFMCCSCLRGKGREEELPDDIRAPESSSDLGSIAV